MITTRNEPERYLTRFSNGKDEWQADASRQKGGQGAGLGPHELLEAALATCINIWVRMCADRQGIAVERVSVSVSLKRDAPGIALFDCSVGLDDRLSSEHRAVLQEAAQSCPVWQTLSRKLSIQVHPASIASGDQQPVTAALSGG